MDCDHSQLFRMYICNLKGAGAQPQFFDSTRNVEWNELSPPEVALGDESLPEDFLQRPWGNGAVG